MTAQSYETVAYALEDGVATVSLNRPEKMHALSRTMRRELADAFRRADREARALLLTSEPPSGPDQRAAFSTGQDLGDVRTENLEQTILEEYAPMLSALYGLSIPSVCAVRGAAAGAGLHLALLCDIVIAGRSARFIAPFAKIGLMPAGGGSWILPRLIGRARARAMTLLGEPVTADQAVAWGMIWSAVEDGDLDGEARRIAEKLAAGPTVAFRLGRDALRAGFGGDFEAHLRHEAVLQGEAGRTRDYMEGVAAFLEKRRPRFEGR